MKVMIFVVGKGICVWLLIYVLFKLMIFILGKFVMEYLIEYLVKFGIQDIMVNVSYLYDCIENYFGEGQCFGVCIGYFFEGYVDDDGQVFFDFIGLVGGMKKIQEFGGFFDEIMLVICGDVLIDLDIYLVLFEYCCKGVLVSVIIKEVLMEQVFSYGIVVIEFDGKVKFFQEKLKQEEVLFNLVSIGIYIMELEVLELIFKDKFFDIGFDLFLLLVEKQLLFYV